MSGRGKNKAKKRLTQLVRDGTLYCKKYKMYLDLQTFHRKRCYVYQDRKDGCRYLAKK